MLVWTWGTWPDVLVDFGVQLYVPWRLAAGEVLYRDIAHYTGPLSVYFNTIPFKIFGPSLLALVLWNLPILAGIIAAIYYLSGQIAGRARGIRRWNLLRRLVCVFPPHADRKLQLRLSI